MKCKCGKECGIRVWCEECEEKANRRIDVIRAELNYKTKRFKKKLNKIGKRKLKGV